MSKKTTAYKVKNIAKKAKNSAVKGAQKVGERMASNPVSALYVVGGLLALFVGYKIYKAVNAAFSATTDPAGVDLGINISQSSISVESARGYASQLLTAMSRYGTDENLIEIVFNQLTTPDDVKLVVQAFGLQPYNGVGLPPEGLPAWLDGATPMNLIGWLTEELSRSNSVYKQILPKIKAAGFII